MADRSERCQLGGFRRELPQWRHEEATGDYIRKASDFLPGADTDNTLQSVEEDDEVRESNTQRGRQPNRSKRKRPAKESTNPDNYSDEGSFGESFNNEPPPQRRKPDIRPTAAQAQKAICDSIDRAARRFAQEEGSETLEKAIDDMQMRFAGKITPLQRLYVIEALQAPRVAMSYCRMDEETKAAFMDRVLAGKSGDIDGS
jgi:hypothetical protein